MVECVVGGVFSAAFPLLLLGVVQTRTSSAGTHADLVYFLSHAELVALVIAVTVLDDGVLMLDAFMQDGRVSLLQLPMQLGLRNRL